MKNADIIEKIKRNLILIEHKSIELIEIFKVKIKKIN